MRTVGLFIEGQRLDLFPGDEIKVVSSIQNVQDISKIFTEFTQSFTVPATENNNQIFQYFYDYDYDGNIDHQLRRNGYIEIDTVLFRVGRVQLEKAEKKKGRIEYYSISFYGAVLSLKDLLGSGKLSDLNLSAYTHEYTYEEVRDRVTLDSDYDIRYPLISSGRVWQYDNVSTPTQNIDTSSGAINYRELFPAIRVKSLFEAIETDYGIDFQGLILDDDKFNNFYLYAKNSDSPLVLSVAQVINMVSTNATGASYFDLVNDIVNYSYTENITNIYGNVSVVSGVHTLTLNVFDVSDTAVVYYIDVYNDNVLLNTISGLGNNAYILRTEANESGLDRSVQIKIRTNGALTFTTKVNYQFVYQYVNPSTGVINSLALLTYANGATQTTTSDIDISTLLPDMLITDFISGVFKEMNMTCYGINQTTFLVEPLEDFYLRGNIIDITRWVDADSITIERLKLYKKIDFKFQVSESFMNKQYKELYAKEYGELSQAFDYDGSDYTIDVPFENLLFSNLDGVNLQVGYNLTKAPDFKPYTPKPTLLYLYPEQKSVSFYLTDGVTPEEITDYVPFGQDTIATGMTYTMNFADEVSSLLLTNGLNTAYQTYYSPYLLNLFNPKNRLTRCKTILPLNILYKLKLNDRLVIRDHRFIINDMTVNLSTGQVDFSLINDFRRLRVRRPIKTPNTGTPIKYNFPVLNGTKEVNIDVGTTGIIVSPSTFTEDTQLQITLPSPEKTRVISEAGEYVESEDNLNLIIVENQDQYPDTRTITATTTLEDGTTIEEDIIILIG